MTSHQMVYVGPPPAMFLEPLAHHRNVARLSVYSLTITLVDVYRNWLNWFHLLILVAVPIFYFNRLHDFSIIFSRCYKDVSVNGFFPRTPRLWNAFL